MIVVLLASLETAREGTYPQKETHPYFDYQQGTPLDLVERSGSEHHVTLHSLSDRHATGLPPTTF